MSATPDDLRLVSRSRAERGGGDVVSADRDRPPPVLVVDDDPTRGTTTLAWLADVGYATVVAPDGDAALRLARAEVLRLVVAELYVPCAEGPCVVTALLRDRTRLPRLRVLVHTRHTTGADDAWALAAGCDAVLHKPGSAGALVREVRRLDGAEWIEPGSGASRTGGRP